MRDSKTVIMMLMTAGITTANYGWGSCPTPNSVVEDLDIERSMGKWHDYYLDTSSWGNSDFSCGVTTLELTDKKKKTFKNKYTYEIWYWPFNQHGYTMDVKCSEDGLGNCSTDFWESETFDMENPNAHVLATDYDTYSIIY